MSARRGQEDSARKSHVEDGLEIPDHLEGVTFDQKKRLARLAKMGLGPVAKPGPAENVRRAVAPSAAAGAPAEDALAQQQQQLERRAALLERDRRLRLELQRQEEEEQSQQREEERKRQEREKALRARAGLKSLGPVQPREEAVNPKTTKPTVGYPTPAPLPFLEAAKAPAPGKMEVKLYASTVERVSSSTHVLQEERATDRNAKAGDNSDSEEDAGRGASSSTVAAAQHKQPAEKRSVQEDKRRKKVKKKRKRKDSSDSEDDRPASSDGEPQEDAHSKEAADTAKRQPRDGGVSWNVMQMDSVKGKVSNDNKGFTDADLERRFGSRDTVPTGGGLMTEQEVLAIMRKDKKGKSDSDWAMRRAQRELAEWTTLKAQRMARSGEEKERLVVSGRGSKVG